MSPATLQPAGNGLRVQLDEAGWAAALAAAGVEDAGILASLPGDPGQAAPGAGADTDVDEAVREAARHATGPAPVVFEVLTGHGDRGVLARITTDGTTATTAVRAVVPGAGSAPAAVPGVELSLTRAEHVVEEIMRTVPPVGLQRHLDEEPVRLPHDVALIAVRALGSGDGEAARDLLTTTGIDEVPAVIEALAEGSIASVSLTVRAGARITVQQWLCTADGWVALALAGTDLVHTARSRDEIRRDLVSLVAGELTSLTGPTATSTTGDEDE